MTTLTDYLEERDIEYELLDHARAFTGIDEARSLGVKADEVIKTVICDTEATTSRWCCPAVNGST